MRSPLVYRLVACAAVVVTACAPGSADDSSAGEPASVASARWDSARIDTLLRLGREDQDGRDVLARAAITQDTGVIFSAMRADSARTAWLRNAVTRHGWPGRTTAGDSAQQAAWHILQHSPDTAWQAAMLPDLERPPADVALLTDRILVHRGQPQRYGSQFEMEDGRLVPAPVEDLQEIDARRAEGRVAANG